MNFINQCPIGRDNPVLQSSNDSIYFLKIDVKVFNQNDLVANVESGTFGVLAVPRWEHTFSSKGNAVYKPSDGDRLKYKARVNVRWKEEYAQGGSWYEKDHGDYTHWVENLADGGQYITITPRFGVPRDITLSASMDPPSSSQPLMVAGGTLYFVNSAGDLLMYRHRADGEFENYNGQKIGVGWGGLKHICPVRDGHIYAISTNDELLYYHHNANGDFDVSGQAIGHGWGAMQWVGAGRFGQIYGVTTNGDLLYYQHGSGFNWEISGQQIGNGWGGFSRLLTGGTNCLYGVATNGDLLYYYHNDSLVWVHAGKAIGNGWDGFTSLSSSGNGELYAVNTDGELLFYRHDVNTNWIPGSPRVIGWDWRGFSTHGVLASAR